MDFYKRYNLRNKGTKESVNKHSNDQPSNSQSNQEDVKADHPKKYTNVKEPEVLQSSFSLRNEILKIKNYVPFNELLRNAVYKNQIVKIIKGEED